MYGAGLAGLTAAINLAQKGHQVTIYEKEAHIGGPKNCTPAIHMTPLHFTRLKKFINIDLTPCFSPLNLFKAYIYTKKVYFHPHHLYVTERGPQKTSLDYYLYQQALKNDVAFEFSQPLTPKTLQHLPNNSIIATGTYSCPSEYLNISYSPFIHFNSHKKTTNTKNFCIAFFEPYIKGYGYAYIAGNKRFTSVEIDFQCSQSHQKLLQHFINYLEKKLKLRFSRWTGMIDNIPKKTVLFTKLQNKTIILAGSLSGFHDPFFGFGVNSALVSGKIASITIDSKQKGIHVFNQFNTQLQKMFLFAKIYHAFPLKKLSIPRFILTSRTSLPFIKNNLQCIPGFTHNDCFKIERIQK